MVLALYVKQRILQLYSEGEISYDKIVKRLSIEGFKVRKMAVWVTIKYQRERTIDRNRGIWKTFQAHIRYSNTFPSYRGDPFPKYFTVIVSIAIAQISFEQCLRNILWCF